jgi:hypothetical protein
MERAVLGFSRRRLIWVSEGLPNGPEVDMSTTDSSAATAERTADAVRPFEVNVPDAEVEDLRQPIQATRWLEKETVADASQGVQLATMQELGRLQAAFKPLRERSQS